MLYAIWYSFCVDPSLSLQIPAKVGDVIDEQVVPGAIRGAKKARDMGELRIVWCFV